KFKHWTHRPRLCSRLDAPGGLTGGIGWARADVGSCRRGSVEAASRRARKQEGKELQMKPRTGVGLLTWAALVLTMAFASVASAASGVMPWGSNFSGQLGNGGFSNHSAPVTLAEPTTVTAVSAGGEFSLALLESGHAKAWGENLAGQ